MSLAALLGRHIGAGHPGAVALVAHGDEVVIETAGVSDVASGAPMRRDGLFRIASLTKPVTAFAALALVERGVLDLDAPVDGWLPELAGRRVLSAGAASALDDTVPAARAITLRDLLSCQFGLGAIMAEPGTYPIQKAIDDAGIMRGFDRLPFTHDAYLARVAALPLVHQPGQGWLYHMGLEVAGILLARAAGAPLADVFAEHVFAPLGMHETAFQVPPEKLDRLATLYQPTADGSFAARPEMGAAEFGHPPVFESGGGQGGALVSTVADFAKFARRLRAGGRAVAAMTTDQVTPQTKASYPFYPGFWDEHGWGLGLAIQTSSGRFGWEGGFGTHFFVDSAADGVAILFTQRSVTSPAPVPLMADFEKLALPA